MQNEKLNIVHKMLKVPALYLLLQKALNRKDADTFIFNDVCNIKPTDRILDFGCGAARYRHHINTQQYVGIDFNEAHIKLAQQLYPNDTFICANIVDMNESLGLFDKIIMIGILHHISDQEAKAVLQACKRLLKPNGQIYARDPVFEQNQNPIARLIAKLDQGNHVRYTDAYCQLASEYFDNIKTYIKRDSLRVPNSHLFMTLTNHVA